MKHYLHALLLCCLVALTGSLSLRAQTLQSATIQNGSNSNRLTVVFSEAITVSDNGAGFRLVGGVARIERLLSGSGSSTLTFVLTNYVLPGDAFKLLHWPEMSDARSASGKLGAIDRAVTNQVSSYSGSGVLYYVSTSGKDTNNGRSANAPFQSVGKALGLAQPGDFILLKRGDVWNQTNVVITKSGTANNYLTIAAYGSGNKPVIDNSVDATFIVRGGDFVAIDNINIKVRQKSEPGAGVRIENNSDYIIVSNCLIEGYNGASFGVHLQKLGGPDGNGVTTIKAPLIVNNYITGFITNIRASGYRYNNQYHVIGGLIENNTCRNSTNDDGANLQRGYFNNLIFRKNDIAGYDDDGIDTYGAHDLIIEYNTVHDPQPTSTRGKGIKAGGIIRSSENASFEGIQSSGIVVRYNVVRDIRAVANCECDGIVTNGGGSGSIYGNVIYNTKGHGMKVDGSPSNWSIFNNTVVNADKTGFQFYTDSNASGTVLVSNNIFQGNEKDFHLAQIGNLSITGGKNITLDDAPPSNSRYSGTGDFQSSKQALFGSNNPTNYQLVTGAPAIDAGSTAIPAYPRDVRGFLINNKPDIGAFEFGNKMGPLEPTAPEAVHVWLEAECADNVGSAWETLSDNAASQSSYLKVLPGNSSASSAPTDPNKQLTFSFSVSKAGQYIIYTRQRETGQNNDDSFWLKVNNASWTLEGLGGPSGSFYWEAAGNGLGYSLAAGSNTITIGTREDNVQLDKIYITLEGNAPSGLGQAASNCTATPPPPTPVVTADAGSDRTVSLGSTVQLYGRGLGPNPFRAYLWEKVTGPNLTLTTRGANATLTNLQVGTYEFKFTATDSEGNSGSDNVKVTVTGSNARTASSTKGRDLIEEGLLEADSTLIAYPNPSNELLMIRLGGNVAQSGVLSLTDLSGRVVHRQNVSSSQTTNTLEVPTDKLPEGMYLLRWQQANKQQVSKVLIRH